jgi:hypothetical protein
LRGTTWYLDYNNNGVWDPAIDKRFNFGRTGRPVVGDWTGTGISCIGILRNESSVARWYLDRNGNGAWDGSQIDGYYTFGRSGDIPIAGQW